MAALNCDLRKQLENVCIAARDKSEDAARSALQKRAVDAAEPHSHFTAADKEIRNRLRARGRQVGDVRHANKKQDIDQLTQELAYEYWHRMLFARFLAENHLLMHPDGVAVSLEECEELAKSENVPNGFVLAARYASKMLPQVFRTDDVLLEIEFAPEQRLGLERELAKLPRETFLADDSLGWVYQFWQTKKKEDVNASGEKIDGRTLPAVTQLFTEDYMVQFLLHNTIGAWWCSRHGITGPPGGAGVPAGQAPVELPYLRWRDNGTPAAGSFNGWPKTLKDFTMLDPCCGSGHFLVNAFNLLVPLRIHAEHVSAKDACDAVLQENLFGLELDPRCTQIAAFALALAAWKYPGEDNQPLGYRVLPPLNIACSGQCVAGKKEEWLAFANEDQRLREGMARLFDLFQQAPHLGSLIDPRREKGNMYEASYTELKPLLNAALANNVGNADLAAISVAAQGISRAAELLGRKYTLVITNVPYLGRNKQHSIIRQYLEKHYKGGKADLATAFIQRTLAMCLTGGTSALVTPQNWLFLTSYRKLRESTLANCSWNIVARLGANAFQDMNFWAATTALITISAETPSSKWQFAEIDVSADKDQGVKADRLANRKRTDVTIALQDEQLKNPDARIATHQTTSIPLLNEFAIAVQGLATHDEPRFAILFWEVMTISYPWEPLAGTVEETCHYGGRSYIFKWCNGGGEYKANAMALKAEGRLGGWKSGKQAWGKQGVSISQMNLLPCTLFTGDFFDQSAAIIVPNDETNIIAIWCFCTSSEYVNEVRKIDQAVKVTNSSLAKVPFDHLRWQNIAEVKYPHGLPKPHSDDPTQWLFDGSIRTSVAPLQVALCRMLGYRWPEQIKGTDGIDNLSDSDGIVCLPGVRGEPAAAERLHEVLYAAYDTNLPDSVLHRLLTDAGCKSGTTVDEWLRNQFFEQHCKLFHNRPFIWHIWDGRKDGFSCLVNYHKLNYKTLENLTYSYLGDWINAQAAEAKAGKTGSDLRLGAAQELQTKLKLLLAGEPPYDIFVRWKQLSEQAIGWHPDLNDGVRINIRPFVEAGILRKNPNIKWTKDRGKEPDRDKAEYPWFWKGKEFVGERINDAHLTNAEKQATRKGAK